MMGKEEEEDYGALIYRESQLRKAEAAAAAEEKDAKKKKTSTKSYCFNSTSSCSKFNSGNVSCCYKERCGECCKREEYVKEQESISKGRR